MAAAIIDRSLTVPQGADVTYAWVWKTQASELEPPVAKDLTGWSARMQIRLLDNRALLLTLTSSSGSITLSSTGQITAKIRASDTSTGLWLRKPLPARYDLVLTSPTNEVVRVSEGSVSISVQQTEGV